MSLPEVELVRSPSADVEVTIETRAEGQGDVPPAARLAGFEGKPGQTCFVDGLLLVGVGKRESLDGRVARRAAVAAARAAARAAVVAAPLPTDPANVGPVVEGLLLGAYGFTGYKSDPGPHDLRRVELVGGGGAAVRRTIERASTIARAVCLARDLVNEPGGALTPPVFADRIAAAVGERGVSVEVLDEKAIRKAGHVGLLAVNRGSTHPPRFVELTYEPAAGKPRGTVALVGKGITFDAGGLSIKTAEGMIGMKGDMGGAAAVVGAMTACAELGVRTRVRAFLPITDNMLGGDAQRVGDVIRYRNGRTVEVINTDAEGRLILADALVAASDEKPGAIIDLATLTGAAMVALGAKIAGLFANHDGWRDQITAAAEAAGESVWPLPIHDPYRKDMDSAIADIANVAPHRYGGAIQGALFLKEFVGEGIPWAHLDIAGPAFTSLPDDESPAGGTGFGVRTLVELLAGYRRPS